MKNLKSIAYLVGSLVVVACSGGDSSAGAPSDPVATVAPLKQASAQAVADAIALRDQLQAESNGDASVVAPGHRLVKIAKIHQRAVEEMEAMMEQAIAEHNGTTGAITTKNTGGGSGGTGASGNTDPNAADAGEVATGDPDLDNMDDDLDDMDDDLDQEDDDLNPTDPDGGADDPTNEDGGMDDGVDSGAPTNPTRPAAGGMDAGATDPCACTNGGGGGGKPSAGKGGGKGGGAKPGGGKTAGGGGKPKPGGAGKPSGASGAALQKLIEKLMKMLDKAAASPTAAASKAKTPKAAKQAQATQADLNALYKLLNDPVFKKWQKFGGAP